MWAWGAAALTSRIRLARRVNRTIPSRRLYQGGMARLATGGRGLGLTGELLVKGQSAWRPAPPLSLPGDLSDIYVYEVRMAASLPSRLCRQIPGKPDFRSSSC